MLLLTLLSYLSIIIQLCFVTISLAAGLYYLAELVEEYTVFTKKVITWTNLATVVIFLLLWVFEGFPTFMCLCGLLSTVNHFLLLQNFPYITFTSPTFIVGIVFVVLNHYLAFDYFGDVYYSFSEILAYFTLCLWIVPFALFVSLSANEYVLPTTTAERMDGDVVTNYFSKKGKKYSLLSLFNYMKTSVLPTQMKKGF